MYERYIESEEMYMMYSIHVNKVKAKDGQQGGIVSPLRGFATVVFGDSFKITNIAILENAQTEKLFVSMPRYKSSERGENGGTIYKDVCNPITKEFRDELYGNIIEAFEKVKEQENGKIVAGEKEEMPAFSIQVTAFEREGSNIRGLARIYFEDSFVVNNVSVLQGKDEVFVAMPSYKTNQKEEHGKAIYQDVCYPVTKEFREKLYGEVIREYKDVKEKNMKQEKDEEQQAQVSNKPERDTPFR